jgi:hypothetical protein
MCVVCTSTNKKKLNLSRICVARVDGGVAHFRLVDVRVVRHDHCRHFSFAVVAVVVETPVDL